MKFAVCAILLLASASAIAPAAPKDKESAKDIAITKAIESALAPKDKKAAKPAEDVTSSVMSSMQSVMAMAQMSLQKAQRHHEKVVKKVRNKIEQGFTAEASSLGEALAHYSADLDEATALLSRSINVSKVELAKSEAIPSKAGDWGGPEVTARAQLGAKIGAAEQLLRRSLRRKESEVKEAEVKAEDPLEESAQHFSRKVGDLSEVVDKVKSTLEEKMQVPVSAGNASTNATILGSGVARLASAQKQLAAATAASQVATKASTKKLNAFLEQSEKRIADQITAAEKDMVTAEQKEMAKIRGTNANAKSTLPAAKATTKAVAKAVAKAPVKHKF